MKSTKWNYAEGVDAAGNKVIQTEEGTKIITADALYGTPWKSVAWIGAFTVSSIALVWLVRKKEDTSLKHLAYIAVVGIAVGLTGMQVKKVFMPKA